MDSGNSGSMNSSSGGDDQEYQSISTLFNPPPPTTQIQNTDSSFNFHPQSNYFNNPFVNPNAAGWSDANRADFNPSLSASLPQLLPAPVPTSSAVNDQAVQTTTTTRVVRNPKKRSRASRRAPTTVLTTDTTNFRAMVQEFTGIPASPFASSSSGPFSRSRLDDFFRVPTSTRSSQTQPQPPNYLLKPFPQKLQKPPPFLSSSSFQSLLQSDPKYNPLLSSLGSKSLVVEANDYGFSRSEISGLPNIASSRGNYGSSSSSSHGLSDGRLSFLAKGSETVIARGEGMMESWICSSD